MKNKRIRDGERATTRPGYTLVELLVAGLVAVLVLGGIYQLITQNQRVYKYQGQLADTQQVVRTALDIMSRDIRQVGSDPSGVAFDSLEPMPLSDLTDHKIHIRMDLPRDCGGLAGDDDPEPCPSMACGGSCEDGDTDDILDKDEDGIISLGPDPPNPDKRGENELGNGFTDDINPDEDIIYVYCQNPDGVWDDDLCPDEARFSIVRIVNAEGELVTEPFADGIYMGFDGDPVDPLRPMFEYEPSADDPEVVVVTVRGRTRDPDPQSGEYKYVELTSRIQLRNM